MQSVSIAQQIRSNGITCQRNLFFLPSLQLMPTGEEKKCLIMFKETTPAGFHFIDILLFVPLPAYLTL